MKPRRFLRRRWVVVLASLIGGILLYWGVTWVAAPQALNRQLLVDWSKIETDRKGIEHRVEVRLDCEFEGEDMKYGAIDRPKSVYWICVSRPRVVGPGLVKVDYERSGPGGFDAGAFTLTFFWTPWKIYYVGDSIIWIS